MSDYAYSFKNITVIVGGKTITGFMEGDSVITIEYESPIIADISGADGDTVTSFLQDKRATITLSLHKSSPANDVFSIIKTAYLSGTIVPTPLLIKDSAGRDLHAASHVSLLSNPTINYGANSSAVEWTLRAPALVSYVGGGQKLA